MNDRWLSNFRYWRYLLYLAGLQLLLLQAFRLLLVALNTDRITHEFPEYIKDIIPLSLRFDGMIVAYTCLPVLLFFLIGQFSPGFRQSRGMRWTLLGYWMVMNAVELLLLCTDLPYYAFFNERLNPSVMLWVNNPGMMLGLVAGSPEYYPYLLAFALLIWMLSWRQHRWIVAWQSVPVPPAGPSMLSGIGLATLLVVAMRGGWYIRPLEMKDAFISSNNFVNQVSLNPVISYFHSIVNERNSFLSDEIYQQYLEKNGINVTSAYPLAKEIKGDSAKHWNVVLIIMESMTGNMLRQFGNKENITPFLDSLHEVSLSIHGLYTTGTHTCNGVYSTLYGLPSFMGIHPMSNLDAIKQPFYGMPPVLKENGYQTFFVTSHRGNWDNMQFFLRRNGMDTLYDLPSHPLDKQVNAFGVPDEILFESAIQKLDAHASKGPVFATLLSISTHVPHIIANFSKFPQPRRLKDPVKNIYRYADWSLEHFFSLAKTKPWYNNTLFVLVADHGINLEPHMDMPLSFHRSPLIFFKPGMTPEKRNQLASQTDIFPTTMGLLGLPYTRNVMGIDLRKETRASVFFVGNTTIGCVDTAHFFTYRKFGGNTLTRLDDSLQADWSDRLPDKLESLSVNAFGGLQLCSEVLKKQKVGKPN
ncbi:MAG: LTA synthase family protein [Cytophagaceae bacterium]|jgi:phosphoglycerol transferase MdoB-like AlkP superfamily enzyme|nr:LTA synthase family protein [Cytophagaceae bacterium]